MDMRIGIITAIIHPDASHSDTAAVAAMKTTSTYEMTVKRNA